MERIFILLLGWMACTILPAQNCDNFNLYQNNYVYNGPDVLRAENGIYFTGHSVFPNNGFARCFAGGEIKLLPGFLAEEGTDLKIGVAPCDKYWKIGLSNLKVIVPNDIQSYNLGDEPYLLHYGVRSSCTNLCFTNSLQATASLQPLGFGLWSNATASIPEAMGAFEFSDLVPMAEFIPGMEGVESPQKLLELVKEVYPDIFDIDDVGVLIENCAGETVEGFLGFIETIRRIIQRFPFPQRRAVADTVFQLGGLSSLAPVLYPQWTPPFYLPEVGSQIISEVPLSTMGSISLAIESDGSSQSTLNNFFTQGLNSLFQNALNKSMGNTCAIGLNLNNSQATFFLGQRIEQLINLLRIALEDVAQKDQDIFDDVIGGNVLFQLNLSDQFIAQLDLIQQCGINFAGLTAPTETPQAFWTSFDTTLNFQVPNQNSFPVQIQFKGRTPQALSLTYGKGSGGEYQVTMETQQCYQSTGPNLLTPGSCGQKTAENQAVGLNSEQDQESLLNADLRLPQNGFTVRKNGQQPGIRIVPNPSNGKVRLLIKNEINGPFLVEVRDVQGRSLWQKKIIQDQISGFFAGNLDLSFLCPGIYMVCIQSSPGPYIEKLVIR